ncbi:hypothetical protein [Microcoleus sp.]
MKKWRDRIPAISEFDRHIKKSQTARRLTTAKTPQPLVISKQSPANQ